LGKGKLNCGEFLLGIWCMEKKEKISPRRMDAILDTSPLKDL
jgi:hypothetical protein